MNKDKIKEILLEVKEYILADEWNKVLEEVASSYSEDDLIDFNAFLGKEYPEYTVKLTTVPKFTFVYDEGPKRIDLLNVEVIDSDAFYLVEEVDVYLSKKIRKIGIALNNCNRITIHYPGTLEEWKKIELSPLWFGFEVDGTMLECSDGRFFIRETTLGDAKYNRLR